MPSPLATDHRMSPLFKSIATRREYGGLNGSGRPCGPNGHDAVCFTYGSVDSGCCDLPNAMTVGMCADGTYNMPVSGSNAAPPQSAAPFVPGTSSSPLGPSALPSSTGGV